LKRNKKLKR